MDNNEKSTVKVLVHEIKNSITALLFQSENLKKTLPSEYAADFESLDEEIRHLSLLVSGAGEYLKDPEGNPQILNVADLISEISKTIRHEIKIINMEKSPVFISFDKERAQSVFSNLLINACESMEGKNKAVEVLIFQDKDNVHINIMDRGTGVDPAVADKLFNFGFTTKEHGSGLGLFLSENFIVARGGKITLSPRENGGTSVEVVLPRQ